MVSDKDPRPLAEAPTTVSRLVEQPEAFSPRACPWTIHYEPGVPGDLAPSDAVFPAVLADAAASAPTLPALSFHLGRVAYATAQARAEQVARNLVREGLAPGEVVRLALQDCPPWVEAALGALTAGAVIDVDGSAESAAVVIGSPERLRLPETAAAAASARLVLCVDPARELSLQQRWLVRLARLSRREAAAGPDGAVAWSSWLGGRDRDTVALPTVGPEDEALCAGGRRFRHRHLVAGAAQLRSWLVDAASGEETWLLLTPLATPLGFVAGLGSAFALRGRVALLPDWQPAEVMDALRFLRPTWVVASGEAVERLARDPALARADLRSVRGWLVGDPLPPAAARAFEDAAGLELCQGWAPPDAAGLASLQPINGRRRAGSVGLPLPGVVPRPTAGGLVVDGPNVLESARDRAGVGGRLDEQGWLYLGGSPTPP